MGWKPRAIQRTAHRLSRFLPILVRFVQRDAMEGKPRGPGGKILEVRKEGVNLFRLLGIEILALNSLNRQSQQRTGRKIEERNEERPDGREPTGRRGTSRLGNRLEDRTA